MNQPQLWPAQPQPQYSPKMPLPRTNGRILVKILLYFVGTAIAWFGFFAGTLAATSSNGPFGYFALSFSLLALAGSIFIFFQKKYYIHCLLGLQYLWWILGATAISFAAFLIVFGFTSPNTNRIASALACYVIFFYGISLMWIAHLKPPVAQQVNESVYRILKKMPGKQIGLIDLLTCLQKEYKQLGSTVNQYLENIEYIEQVDIPGTSTIVVLMRNKKQQLAFPQVATIMNPTLRANIERALLDLTEESVDIGLFLLGREFETTLKAYLVAAYAKGKLKSVPGNKIPGKDRLALNEMISCLKINDIVTDDAVLSYLRQTRNDRAHGSTPNLAERQLLMKNVQLLAGLYIDYIKWLDDLTHSLDT